MTKKLIIVESPAKIKTLKKILGPSFNIISSVGHIRDLPAKEFGIDIENNFEPKYVNLDDKKDVIKKIKEEAKKSDIVYLSPDPDREGEAIAWHIHQILPKNTKIKRMAFHSITKSAVSDALQHPRNIDMPLVNAQQARRLLDRMVGYKISPILTRKIKRGKASSAGRVQSVALKLVVDREKAIDEFNPVEYWNIKAALLANQKEFEAFLYSVNGKKVEKEKTDKKDVFLIPDEKTAKKIESDLKAAKYTVKNIEKKEKTRKPIAPFITSTLQQEASRHYGYAVGRTMGIAQTLYEGIDLGEAGTEGLITYMRTDSVQLSPEAISSGRSYISEKYGKKYLPATPNKYSSKKSAQEAHEAIRPTNPFNTPDSIKQYLTPDQYKIYLLIWKRFIACQMNPAIYDTVSADIDTDKKMLLRATGSIIKFPGFLAVYIEKFDDKAEDHEENLLPPLVENQKLDLQEILSSQSFTKAPPRFTEASLVKELEKSGIGRPSTYAAIMNKIQSRDYTIKEKNTLRPTELGKITAQMLEDNFKPIMDPNFTSKMEDQLELVAEDEKDWRQILKEFWDVFEPMVEKAKKDAVVPKIITDKPCPKCGKPLQKIWSKNGYFYGCSNYPECEFTSPIEALDFKKEDYAEDFEWNQKCPKCGSDMELRYGRFGPFLGCSKYPECQGIINIPKKGEITLKPSERPDCPAIGCDGKIVMRRTRYGKIFYSCSNFPDCDIIVNDLKDLEPKYDAHHPKTAYIKKKKGAKNSKGTKGSKGKSSSKSSFTKGFSLTPELIEITGSDNLSRGEVVKKTWDYIKKHKLQNPENKREIVPDKKLAKIIGKDPIDMMKLAGFLGKHINK